VGREANKEDKRGRIREAAAALFVERGFEGTTTTAVAERAGVAKGTLFLYASTKEDLVALVFEHRLTSAVEAAFASMPVNGTIAEEAEHLFGAFLSFYAPQPELARIFVRELMFPGAAAARVRDGVDRAFLGRLRERIAAHMAAGELTKSVMPEMIASMWFGLYVVVLIAWLGGSLPAHTHARALLRSAIDLSIRGLLPLVPNQGDASCPPPPKKRPTSTKPRPASARTARATSRRTASATAATKTRGSR
jgi:AcrR family transcriptional regulator